MNGYQSTMNTLTSEYNRVPDDLGLMQYGKEYNLLPQQGSDTLQAARTQMGLYANPAADLYVTGTGAFQMYNSASSECDKGCVAFHPDPRVKMVKPLYQSNMDSNDSHFKNFTSMY